MPYVLYRETWFQHNCRFLLGVSRPSTTPPQPQLQRPNALILPGIPFLLGPCGVVVATCVGQNLGVLDADVACYDFHVISHRFLELGH